MEWIKRKLSSCAITNSAIANTDMSQAQYDNLNNMVSALMVKIWSSIFN